MRTAPHTEGMGIRPAFTQRKRYADMIQHTDIEELDLEDEDYFPADRFDQNGLYILSPEEEAGIKESLEQAARGEIISNGDLMKEVEEWFKKS